MKGLLGRTFILKDLLTSLRKIPAMGFPYSIGSSTKTVLAPKSKQSLRLNVYVLGLGSSG